MLENKTAVQPNLFKKVVVVVALMLFIAAIHIFRLGTYLSGDLFIWYYSFFSDIIIPIGIYFMLCINEDSIPLLKVWKTKAAIVFVLAAATETAQAFGIPLLGSTFDPLDYVMYAVGVSIAVVLDRLFSVVFSFWSFGDEKSTDA